MIHLFGRPMTLLDNTCCQSGVLCTTRLGMTVLSSPSLRVRTTLIWRKTGLLPPAVREPCGQGRHEEPHEAVGQAPAVGSSPCDNPNKGQDHESAERQQSSTMVLLGQDTGWVGAVTPDGRKLSATYNLLGIHHPL